MRVKYRCQVCKTEREIPVPDRARAVDVVLWMDGVAERAGADHSIRAPSCPSRAVDLLIPVAEDAGYVGAPGSDKVEGELPSFDKLEHEKQFKPEDTLE